MNKNVVCLCCDANFFALAKGTVLSLLDLFPQRDLFDIAFLDIGLEPEQLSWLQERDIIIRHFDDTNIFTSLPDYFQNYHKSLVARPFLPKIFPGYDVYVQCDTDIWIQNAECIETFINYARDYAPKVAIVPTVDLSYTFNYGHYTEGNYGRFIDMMQSWYTANYDENVKGFMYGRALFSAGVFALHASSDIWKRWAREFEVIYSKDLSEKMWAMHLSEQCALNKVIYETGHFTPMDATYNYNCHIGTMKRDSKTDKVVIDYPPYREIGAIHMTVSSQFMPDYLKNGILYQSGAYLTEKERAQLALMGPKEV